jgi:hypothetical protein
METEMAIPCVPPPGNVVGVRRQAHWCADAEVEGVQPVIERCTFARRRHR